MVPEEPAGAPPATPVQPEMGASHHSGDASRKPPMDPARTLAHRFLSLSFVDRMEVAQTLKLLRDEDEGLTEGERSRQLFVRAKETRQLAQLWDEVERHHGDHKYVVNPFESPNS